MFAKQSSLLSFLFVGGLAGLTAVGCASADGPDARQLPPLFFDAAVAAADAPAADARPADARPADARPADARPADAPIAFDAPMDTPDAMEGQPDAPVSTGEATLILNEVSPSIAAGRDLVELYAVTGGTVNNIQLYQDITAGVDLLIRLPDVTVADGDLLVIHLNPTDTEISELGADDECTDALCYAGAWDFAGADIQIGYSDRVLYLVSPADSFMDAVAFMRRDRGNIPTPPANWPADLLYITGDSPDGVEFWNETCADPCDYDYVDNMFGATVDWSGAGAGPTGDTIQRKTGAPNTRTISDWETVSAPQTLGLPN